jgi:hypothetical protein
MSEGVAENFDVAARLAQGGPAVDTVQQYVWACRDLGYHHQDLTLHPSQVRDWYGTEDGMDLGALQRGCAALESAVHASQDALAVQDRQSAKLSAVWQGVAGDTAQNFLRRHGDASSAVAAAVHTAADALVALREDLWREVQAKADAVVAIEGRAQSTRADWLAAATTVTSGVGDRSAASELVDTAVKPFVDNSIRTDWLAAMHATVAAVTAAYERALSEMAAERPPVFDVPGFLGRPPTPPAPVCDEQPPAPAAAAASPAATAPSSWSGPAPAAAFAPAPVTVPAPAPAPAPASAAAPMPLADPAPAAPSPVPPMGSMGSTIPGMGGGLAGLGQPFTDALSGLLGGGSSGFPEPDLPEPDLPEPEELEPEEDDEVTDGELPDDPDAEAEIEADEAVVPGEAVVTDDADEVQDPCEPVATPAPTPAPVPAPPPAEPLPPPAEPVAAEQTPCEIAADEVPQVGEPPE